MFILTFTGVILSPTYSIPQHRKYKYTVNINIVPNFTMNFMRFNVYVRIGSSGYAWFYLMLRLREDECFLCICIIDSKNSLGSILEFYS